MTTNRLLTVLIMIHALLAIGCTSSSTSDFTRQEKALITNLKYGEIMRILTIDNKEDSLFLRRDALPVSKEMVESELFKQLCQRMLATVKNPSNVGVGIAAPQVGIQRALIAVQRLDKEGEPFEFFVNPKISSYSDETGEEIEGCLSIPKLSGVVKRSKFITIQYLDPESFEEMEEVVKGFTAIIFQHEVDHLEGKLFIDRCDPMTEEEFNEFQRKVFEFDQSDDSDIETVE